MWCVQLLNRHSFKIFNLKKFHQQKNFNNKIIQNNFLKCNNQLIQINQRNFSSVNLHNSNLSYEFGRLKNLNTTLSPLTVGELLKRSVKISPNRKAFIVRHQNIEKTFKEFDLDTDQLAAALKQIGCKRGSLVAICAINCYEWLLTQFATAKIGAIMVALNPGYKEHELLNCMKLVQVDTLIMSQKFKTSNYYEIVENISPGIFAQARGHQVESKQLPHLKNIIVIDQNEEIVPQNVCRFSQLMSMQINNTDTIQLLENETQFDDVINIQFTSGTTGFPKGSMSTHFNIIQNIQFTSPIFFDGFGFGENQTQQEEEEERAIICLPNPMYHAFGCVGGSSSSIYSRATLVLTGPIFNAEETLKTIEQYKCNTLYGTPTMWSDVLHCKSYQSYNLTSLKRGVMSGSPCPPILIKKSLETFPSLKNIVIPYGSTELGPVATCTTVQDDPNHQLNSVGRPIPFVEIKVIDLKSGRVLPRGQAGEVCVRSHGTFPGYINQVEKTQEVIDSNFWYHTGDVGVMDQEGYLSINGRIKEMIIRGGENIYPREVEELVFKFYPDSIEDIHVVGIPDERMGEEMVAYIKLKINSNQQPQLTEDNFKSYLKTKMSHFKVPKHVRFVEDFPRTPTGKVRKVELKQLALKQFSKENQNQN